MKYLISLLTLGLCGCATTRSVRPTRGLFDPVFDSLSTPHDATWGPMMVIAACTVLIGIIAFWAFKARRTGVGLVITGFGVGFLARLLQEYEAQLALMLIVVTVAGAIYALTNANFRNKLRKHAAYLRGKGQIKEAEALEAEADDEVELTIRKEKKNGTRKPFSRRRYSFDAAQTNRKGRNRR